MITKDLHDKKDIIVHLEAQLQLNVQQVLTQIELIFGQKINVQFVHLDTIVLKVLLIQI